MTLDGTIALAGSPLTHFDDVRPRILADVASKTMQDFAQTPLDLVLGEALYSERVRLKRERPNLFTKGRFKADRRVLGQVQSGLLKSSAEVDRKTLLQAMVNHYAEEIGGHFNPRVYGLATHAVPWFFSWLFNVASLERVLPWGLRASVDSKVRIVGEVPMLQRLARRGTILLVPTHQSNIDSVVIGYIIYRMSLPPFAYGAGLNLFSNPLLSFFMGRLGAYTVDRRKSNEIYKHCLKNYSTRILREGIHSIFFPGGGRARSGALEHKLKLGLLGTALEAQIDGHLAGSPKPNIFVVPMVTSYHFVLEASSLIEDYLAEAGKHRYIIMDDESWQVAKVAKFFWKFFSSESDLTIRIGRPMDVFGNFVDENGRSIGPNGTTIDPVRLFTTRGELCHDEQRDTEYTRRLGAKLVDRFHRDNTVLTSHLAAFAYFETLRSKYPELDLYRFLRLSVEQRSLPYTEFAASAERFHQRLLSLAHHGNVFVADELKTSDTEKWLKDGIRKLGLLHDAAVLRVRDGGVWTEDMNLLYYYRNRLSGYGLSLLAEFGEGKEVPGRIDAKGFLA